MGAVRMRVQTADKNITDSNPQYSSPSMFCEVKMFCEVLLNFLFQTVAS